MGKKEESYEVVTSDNELQTISVMMDALHRHLSNRGFSPEASDEEIAEGYKNMVRCAKYVLDRVSDY